MRIPVATFLAALALAGCSAQKTQGAQDLNGSTSPSSAGSTPSSPSADGGTPVAGGDSSGGSATDGGTSTPTAASPDPMVARTTYQTPTTVTERTVASSNNGGSPSVTAYSYSVLPAVSGWSALQTAAYPLVDLGQANQLVSGSFTDTVGVSRLGYKFTIAGQQTPDWGGSPRVEFDSASGPVQNPADGMPDAKGWSAGVVTDGMEMWFSWSMYLDSSFSLNQAWCTLFQMHPGNTNYDTGSSQNAWPNLRWPTLEVYQNVLSFGMGPDANSPNQVWTGTLADYRGKWTDLAVHIKFSTGSDGLMEFYVNGTKVGSQSGPNMVYATIGGTPPWYYLKQGYYRDPSVNTTDTVYQTPILVSVVSK